MTQAQAATMSRTVPTALTFSFIAKSPDCFKNPCSADQYNEYYGKIVPNMSRGKEF